MPVEIIENKNSYYIPMDGPWQSEEDDAAYRAAERLFNEQKETNEYVALVQSHHQCSHGYWIELKKKEVKYPDHILKEHKSDNN
jgi:hypothetical protein